MPLILTDIDVKIIQELLKDGRKSFREISRATGISTPTVKTRYDRLLNIGFIKSISPIFDFEKIDPETITSRYIKRIIESNKHGHGDKNYNRLIKKDLGIQLKCDYCKDIISGKTHIFKFANMERYLCCINCRASYKEKYKGRIESLQKKYRKEE
ncbi:MAG: AsnC family transcriptional regulator [Nitrososphaeraceae archaeon]